MPFKMFFFSGLCFIHSSQNINLIRTLKRFYATNRHFAARPKPKWRRIRRFSSSDLMHYCGLLSLFGTLLNILIDKYLY